MAPAEEIAAKLRERVEAFFGNLGHVFGAPCSTTFGVDTFFHRGKHGNVRETHQERTLPMQTDLRKVGPGSSLEELFYSRLSQRLSLT